MGTEPMSEGVGLPFSVYDPRHIVCFSDIVFTDIHSCQFSWDRSMSAILEKHDLLLAAPRAWSLYPYLMRALRRRKDKMELGEF